MAAEPLNPAKCHSHVAPTLTWRCTPICSTGADTISTIFVARPWIRLRQGKARRGQELGSVIEVPCTQALCCPRPDALLSKLRASLATRLGQSVRFARLKNRQCPLYPRSGHLQRTSPCPLCANSGHCAGREGIGGALLRSLTFFALGRRCDKLAVECLNPDHYGHA